MDLWVLYGGCVGLAHWHWGGRGGGGGGACLFLGKEGSFV